MRSKLLIQIIIIIIAPFLQTLPRLCIIFHFLIQDLFKILTKYKAFRYAVWVPLDFSYWKYGAKKKKKKERKQNWRQWYKNHKMPTFDKH